MNIVVNKLFLELKSTTLEYINMHHILYPPPTDSHINTIILIYNNIYSLTTIWVVRICKGPQSLNYTVLRNQ